MDTLEKVIVKIHPMNEQTKPYVITCEHVAPHYIAMRLQKRIFKLIKEELIAEGVESIRVEG